MATLVLAACAGGGDGDRETSRVDDGVDVRIEPHWVPGSGCGDAVLGADETCDDGNREAGDGCDDSCAIEAGFSCWQDGAGWSVCDAVCGDGIVVASESCDDGNAALGDGCDACAIEPGYTCENTGGVSVCSAVCGDGLVLPEAGEACDDGNLHAGDGCSAACAPEPGFCCDPAAGYCVPKLTFVSTDVPQTIADGAYDGSVETMSCVEIAVENPGICNHGRVSDATLELALEHPRVGELTIKLVSPENAVTTLVSLPGYDETEDGDRAGVGFGASLIADAPILFDRRQTDAVSAEHMGGGLGLGEPVCWTDGRCTFVPAPGAATGNEGLGDFDGHLAAGTWQLCVGDSATGHVGMIDSARLSYRAQ